MADPKYENLPGIAYDQPDIYESADLPEADQQEDNSEEENECIEKMQISASDSFNKFKGKQMTGSVDFSDRISRRIRTGYKCGEWQLAAESEKETLQQRYHRLRCESSELFEELLALQEITPEDDKQSLKNMTSQVSSTKQILDDLNFDESNDIDPQADKVIDILRSTGMEYVAGQTALTRIKLRPDSAILAETTRFARLEHRLHLLESTVGPSPERLERLSGEKSVGGLITVAANLSSRTAVLQLSNLDVIEQRLARLLSAMDDIKAASPENPERDIQINKLYDMVKRTEGVSYTNIVSRMLALEALHKQANDFGKSMSELESLQATITSGVQNNKALLQGVQEVFAQNLNHIQNEVKKLDQKMTNLESK